MRSCRRRFRGCHGPGDPATKTGCFLRRLLTRKLRCWHCVLSAACGILKLLVGEFLAVLILDIDFFVLCFVRLDLKSS